MPLDDILEGGGDEDYDVYDVIYRDYFTAQEYYTIKSMKKAARLNNKLLRLGEKGYEKYSGLNSDLQDLLKFYAGEEQSYMIRPQGAPERAARAVIGSVVNMNPLGMIYNAAATYGKYFNAGLNVATQVIDDKESILDPDLWYNSLMNQEKLYDNDSDRALQRKYGKVKAYLAKEYLSGSNFSEIVENYKGKDLEIFNALEDFTNNYDVWNNGILEDYRQAKVSPGRSLARLLVGERSEGGFDSDKDRMFTLVSGTADTIVQIFADPLTYVSFGIGSGAKGLTIFGKSEFFGKVISKKAQAQKLATSGAPDAIYKAFDADPRMVQMWDKFGKQIEDYGDAVKNKQFDKAAELKQKMKIEFPDLATDETIKFNLDAGVFSALKAAEVYSQVDNISKILSGKLENMTFYRDSMVVHRSRRIGIDKARETWYKIGSQEGVNTKQVNALLDEFIQYGADETLARAISMPEYEAIIATRKELGKRVTRLLSRSPGDQPIVLGENAYKTQGTVRAMFRFLAPRNVADIASEMFVRMDVDEQLTVLKGLYRGIMETMGVPKDKIKKIIGERFGSADSHAYSFSTSKIVPWTNQPIEMVGAALEKDLTKTVANLPWWDLQAAAADAAVLSGGTVGGSKSRIFNFLGGAVNSTAISKITNQWSLWTLLPKLGIRGGIDHGTFFGFTAPHTIIKNIFDARTAGSIVTAYTGSLKSQGVASGMIRKALAKITGIKAISPLSVMPAEKRRDIVKIVMQIAKTNNLSRQETYKLINDFILDNVLTKYENFKLDANNLEYLKQLMNYRVDFLDSAASSTSKAIKSGGGIDTVDKIAFMTNPNLSNMYTEYNMAFGKTFQVLEQSRFEAGKVVAPMFQEFTRDFGENFLSNIDLGWMFIKHNGLRTANDAANAIAEVQKSLTKGQKKNIVSQRSGLLKYKRQGLDVNAQMDKLLTRIFSDMYFLFHGSKNTVDMGGRFNDDLFNYFSKATSPREYDDLVAKLDHETYFDLVKNNLVDEPIYSNLRSMEGFQGNLSDFFKVAEDNLWEYMDRAINGLFNQSSVLMWYFGSRAKNAVYEERHVRKFFDNFTGGTIKYDDWLADPKKYNSIVARDAARSKLLAEKFWTEISTQEAVNQTLKFIDNPHVRTYLASSQKNVNRFYRAIEDFYRRVYRLRGESARVIYRMRLTHNGLSNAGLIHEDDDGKQYYVIPFDNVLYSAINPILTLMSGGDVQFLQPQYNHFTGKVTGMNPSFMDDAGVPYLSGPTAAVSVWAMKALAGQVFSESTWVEEIDNVLLGDIGNDIDLYKATVPAFFQRLGTMMNRDDKARSNHSAMLQAIAYNAAYGGMNHPGASPNATAEQKADYLKQIRISAHNIQIMNGLLGLIYPSSTTLQESQELEEYAREMGYTNIRAPFFDIYESILKKYGDDVQDPFALALGIYVGKNPDKLIYTVSREDKAVQPLLKKTETVKKWIINNQKFIETYGEAAYFFAPLDAADISPSVYNWLQAAGLTDNVKVEDYIETLSTAKLRREYFAISEKLELDLEETQDYYQRKVLIDTATEKRKAMKMAFPLLADQLGDDGDFTIGWESKMHRQLNEMLDSGNIPISEGRKKMLQQVMDIFNKAWADLNAPIQYDPTFSRTKKGIRDRTTKELNKIAEGNLYFQQLNRLIFFPMLKFKSRDVVTASAYQGGSYTSIGSFGLTEGGTD